MNKWDERYDKGEYHYGTEPNEFLRAQAERLFATANPQKPAHVLCLADGEGRNSVYLAQLGAHVTAVDISQIGLDKAQRLAEERGVTIQTQLADLTECELPENQYDGVVMIFCHLPGNARPRLYQQIEKSLKPGGWLLAECYTEDQLGRGTGGPPSADLMLSLTELKDAFNQFQLAHGSELVRPVLEGEGHSGDGAVCQYIGFKPPARDSIYQVSSTRSKSSRKIRYVESSAPAVGECKFCLGSLADKDD
ncbi:SAM-dependent methyltransferase [Aliidiomarina soli]|uniref:SAM-dependent methyltransferase n=1 Tax=Aliidiomarina soli TaxID=1928574 RepID=A0A432WE32_9GAMM|nr:class I SAM-dependent methyltransferase [Aliidiomarina soli]RUO31115.1 SAM-dependent methyltransferase [Aliidiomarina soli]